MEIVLGNDEKGVIVKSTSVEEMDSGDKLILSNKLEYKGNGVDNEPEVTMVHSLSSLAKRLPLITAEEYENLCNAEDGIIVSRETAYKINTMDIQRVIVRFTNFNKLTYDKRSRTYKVNNSTITTELGKRLKRRIRRGTGIDITFTITDLTPWMQRPVMVVSYPNIEM